MYCYKPIIIFDAQTVRDKTVLMVADLQNEKEEFVVATLRIAPPMVALTAMNIEIVNQTIDEVRVQQCSVNRDALRFCSLKVYRTCRSGRCISWISKSAGRVVDGARERYYSE